MLVILMGPPGSGKTTLGRKVAERQSAQFYDMDDSMPPVLKEKMRNGELMSDAERERYLCTVKNDLQKLLRRGPVVAGCVLVREAHRRDFLRAFPEAVFFKLSAKTDILLQRLRARKNHFFSEAALHKMLAAEELIHVPHTVIDVNRPVDVIVESIETALETSKK